MAKESFVLLIFLIMARLVSGVEDVQSQIMAAFNYHKTGQWVEAVSKYEAVLPYVRGKMASTIASNAGAIHMKLGEYEAAAKKFQVAAAATPENPEPLFNKAVAHSQLQQYAQAIKHCKLAIQVDPYMHKAYHMLGNILQDLGKPEEAVRYFTMAENLAGSTSAVPVNAAGESSEECKTTSHFSQLGVWNAKINDTYTYRRMSNGDWERLDDSVATSPVLGSGPNDLLIMRCISERPLIFDVPLLLTPEECNHIIYTATPLLERSHVMGRDDAPRASTAADDTHLQDVVSAEPFRSSFNAWLPQDDVLLEMQKRLAALTDIPSSYLQLKSEDLQVVKYDSHGQFQLHQDSSQFHPRMLTALVYLQDVTATEDGGDAGGGDTWFPFAPGPAEREFSATSTAETLTLLQNEVDAGRFQGGLTVKPITGRAIIFFNHLRNGTIDHMAIHSGKKVHNGTKWIANYWIKHDPAFLDEVSGLG